MGNVGVKEARLDKRLMVKQRLGEIPATGKHARFEVFTSAVPGWYIFAPMPAPGVSGTIQFRLKARVSSRAGGNC